MNASRLLYLPLIAILCLPGCQTTQQRLLDSGTSQLQLRSIQSRAFDTADRGVVLRAVIATLQDLDFVIDEADNVLGSVSATKLAGYELRMTVTVRPHGQQQTLVRANAQSGRRCINDPGHYQQFFAALQKAIFLTAQPVD